MAPDAAASPCGRAPAECRLGVGVALPCAGGVGEQPVLSREGGLRLGAGAGCREQRSALRCCPGDGVLTLQGGPLFLEASPSDLSPGTGAKMNRNSPLCPPRAFLKLLLLRSVSLGCG